MRPGGKSNVESPFFETPNLSFEGRVRNVARYGSWRGLKSIYYIAGLGLGRLTLRWGQLGRLGTDAGRVLFYLL